MKLKHWKLGALGLIVPLLIFLLWWPGQEPLSPQQPATPTTIDPAVDAPSEIPIPKARPVRRVHDPECGTCPSMLATAEQWKRSAPLAPDPYLGTLDENDCRGRLLQAATNGIANVNTQDLGGCHDRTPLHVAQTPDQVRALLEAGADVNAQDEFGRTSLHSHAVPFSATEDSLEIVELLLEAGADPRIENESGEAPWKFAALHSNIVPGHLTTHKEITRNAEAEGLSIAEYLALNPGHQQRLDELMDGYLIEALIERRLLAAAVGPIHECDESLREELDQ